MKPGLVLAGLVEKMLLWSPARTLSWILGVVGLVILALVVGHFRKVHSGAAPVAVHIGTSPPGATIRIDSQGVNISNQQVDLKPGDHDIEASLPGYETATAHVSIKPGSPSTVELTLLPLGQALRIAAPDLDVGEASLDDKSAGQLESGALALSNVFAGDHVLKISAPQPAQEDAAIRFRVTPGEMPAVAPSFETHQLQVAVVSTKPGVAHVTSSLGPVAVAVDGKPVGQLGADGLQISNLGQGIHELTLGEGKDLRKMSFEIGLQPALDAVLYSDRDVGSMLVVTGQDGANVFLDGRLYPQQTKRGELRIPNLQTIQHTVHVVKVGFGESGTQKVDIVKGQEARVTFALTPVPKAPPSATLSIEHLIPDVQVFVDDTVVGTVGPDGSLQHPNISPGSHTLRFTMHGYQDKRISRDFAAGETVRLSGTDIDLKSSLATLEVSLRGNTPGTVLRGDQPVQQFTGSSKLTLEEGSYTVVVRPPGGQAISQVVSLVAGESKTIVPTVPTGMELWENSASWIAHDQWFTHRGNGFVLYDAPPGPGEFSFTVVLHHKGPRLKWVVGYTGAMNYMLFEMDNKYFYRTEMIDGKKHDLPKIAHKIGEKNHSVSMRIELSANSLVHRYDLKDDASWQMLDSEDRRDRPSLNQGKPRSFADGKFGFLLQGNDDTVEISNFQFTPRPEH